MLIRESIHAELEMRGGAEGTFDAGPSAYIPNTLWPSLFPSSFLISSPVAFIIAGLFLSASSGKTTHVAAVVHAGGGV
jgi:hypothetical protein